MKFGMLASAECGMRSAKFVLTHNEGFGIVSSSKFRVRNMEFTPHSELHIPHLKFSALRILQSELEILRNPHSALRIRKVFYEE